MKIKWFSFKSYKPYVHVQLTPQTPYHDNPKPSLITKMIHRGEAYWHSYAQAPPKSLKHAIHSLGTRLIARLPPQEYQLRKLYNVNISKIDANSHIEVDEETAAQPAKILTWSNRQYQHHNWWWKVHAVMAFPITILTILPGVKAVLAWVLFRVVTHRRAAKGSKLLFDSVTDGKLKLQINPILTEIKKANDIDSISKILSKNKYILEETEELKESIMQHLTCKNNNKVQ